MAPEISAAVMMAERALVAHESRCGMVPFRLEPDPAQEQTVEQLADQSVAGRRMRASIRSPPTAMPTNPKDTKLIIIVLSAFFDRTSPP